MGASVASPVKIGRRLSSQSDLPPGAFSGCALVDTNHHYLRHLPPPRHTVHLFNYALTLPIQSRAQHVQVVWLSCVVMFRLRRYERAREYLQWTLDRTPNQSTTHVGVFLYLDGYGGNNKLFCFGVVCATSFWIGMHDSLMASLANALS